MELEIEGPTVITVHAKLFATLRRHYPHLGIGEPIPLVEADEVGIFPPVGGG